MPTITSTLGVTLTNLGPLTTTFTAPSSCSSAHNIGIVPTSNPDYIEWSESCSQQELDGCLPPSANSNSGNSTIAQSDGLDGPFIQSYYSPGSICPSGWSTVGVAGRAGDETVSPDGVFVTVSADEPPYLANFLQPQNVLALALEPSETAIACCPSSMDAAPGGGCTSPLPSYKISTGCARIFPAEDLNTVTTTITGDESTITALYHTVTGSPAVTTISTTFPSDVVSKYSAVSQVPMVFMVQKSGAGGAWRGVAGCLLAAAMASAVLAVPW